MDWLRSIVRPVISLAVIGALVALVVAIVCWLLGAPADPTVASKVLPDVIMAFLILVATISGFWFGSRNRKE